MAATLGIILYDSRETQQDKYSTMSKSPYFAAIDLGSNSFHMLVARIDNDQLEVIDREKEMVQIARGLQENGELQIDVKQRAFDCLSRFSERLRDIPSSQIRAVGTKTLRSTRNSADFLKQAEKHLGQSIQIISGYEEARLVYCGLSHTVSNDDKLRMVIDIGGGSTEFVIGKNYDPTMLESLSMGCVAYSNQHFKAAKPFAESMHNAYMAACTELESIRKAYIRKGWKFTYGTSGTIKAIGELVSGTEASVIDYDGLCRLMNETIEAEGVHDKRLPKLRRDVLPAGIAILKAIFDQFKIDQLRVASATLKEGLIFDTVGRFSEDDAREITVVKLVERYNIDTEQAKRVQAVTLKLWNKIKATSPTISGISRTKVLKWAALLHEVGISISHSSYHHHGNYILQHGDLAGFGRYEQYIVATLVKLHRKKIHKNAYGELDAALGKAFAPLLLCLRLAVHLCRRREDLDSIFDFKATGHGFEIQVNHKWIELNPLTHASLLKEIIVLDNLDIFLRLKTISKP